MISKGLSFQLFFLILGNSFAWDGCSSSGAWRCGDACISQLTECKCGDEIFGRKAQKWCCNNNTCDNGECTGRALNLTEACDQKCDYYQDPEIISVVNSDGDGNVRDYIPCNVTHVKTKMRTR